MGVYLVQVGLRPFFEENLTLFPVGDAFRLWQPLTYSFVQPEPFVTVFSVLILVFFLESVLAVMGPRRFWFSTLAVWAVSTTTVLGLGMVEEFAHDAVGGMLWWTASVFVWYGLAHRGQTLRFMFMFPLKAEHAVWLSLALAVLGLGYYRTLEYVLYAVASLAAWAVFSFRPGSFSLFPSPSRTRRAAPFQVLEGGKFGERPRRGKPDEFVN